MISMTLGGCLFILCCYFIPPVLVVIMARILTPKVLAILMIPLVFITGTRRRCPGMWVTAGVCWVELALLLAYLRLVRPNVHGALATLFLFGMFLLGMYPLSRAVGKPVILCFLPCTRHFKPGMPRDDAHVMRDVENDLVSTASARNRAWRRRGWLVMIRARVHRRVPRLLSRCSPIRSLGRSNNAIASWHSVELMDIRYIVMRLAEMKRSDIFRIVVAFI